MFNSCENLDVMKGNLEAEGIGYGLATGMAGGIEMGRNHPYLGIVYWDLVRNITLENSKAYLVVLSLFA